MRRVLLIVAEQLRNQKSLQSQFGQKCDHNSARNTYEVIVQLIGATKTAAGLEVHAYLDEREYEKGRKISDAQMATVDLVPARFHGERNYIIKPKRKD